MVKYKYMWVIIIQRIAFEFLLDVMYFPLWWYFGGAKLVGIKCIHLFQDTNMSLAPLLWLKNIFVPMFGQTDWQGRLTSIFMRFVNIIGRSIALIFATFFIVCLFFVWLLIPPFVLYMIGISLFSL